MKKLLLTTTAVSGIALIAAQAQAAEAPTLTISGTLEYQYIFADNEAKKTQDFLVDDGDGGSDPIDRETLGHQVRADGGNSEIRFLVKGVADNGLNYGFDYQHAIQGTANNDEAYLTFSDSWGLIHFGQDDGVMANNTYGGETALAASGGFDGDALVGAEVDDLISELSFGAVTGPSTIASTGDVNKIAYYSPSFAGARVSASFAPTAEFTDTTGADQTINNVIELAVDYDANFEGFSFGAVAGYRHATDDRSNFEDVSEFELGAKVGFGGFTVGAAYGDNGDTNCPTGVTQCDAGSYWDVGLGYAAGPFNVGVGYFESKGKSDAADATDGDDELEIFTLGGTYTIAQGLTAFAEYNNATFSTGRTGNDLNPDLDFNEVDVQNFIIGTRVVF